LEDRAASRGAGAFAVNWFRPNVKVPEVQANTREANRVSSLKFSLLQTSLQLGYHTLITDMVGWGKGKEGGKQGKARREGGKVGGGWGKE
jgi:hypothetical protein